MTHSLKTFFYHSRLQHEQDLFAVSSIIRTARRLNSLQGITGILIFDGERFCQFIEGPQSAVDSLIDRLYADKRPIEVTCFSSEPVVDVRRFTGWSMAFAAFDGPAYLDDLISRESKDAIRHLQSTLDQLDVG